MQHLKNFKQYWDNAAAIIKQADSKIPELKRELWAIEFERAAIRYNNRAMSLDILALEERFKGISLNELTIADLETIIESLEYLSEAYSKNIEKLKSLLEQERSLVPEDLHARHAHIFIEEISGMEETVDNINISLEKSKALLAEMKNKR